MLCWICSESTINLENIYNFNVSNKKTRSKHLQYLGLRGERVSRTFFRELKCARAFLFQPWISAQKVKESFGIACTVQNLISLFEEQGE